MLFITKTQHAAMKKMLTALSVNAIPKPTPAFIRMPICIKPAINQSKAARASTAFTE